MNGSTRASARTARPACQGLLRHRRRTTPTACRSGIATTPAAPASPSSRSAGHAWPPTAASERQQRGRLRPRARHAPECRGAAAGRELTTMRTRFLPPAMALPAAPRTRRDAHRTDGRADDRLARRPRCGGGADHGAARLQRRRQHHADARERALRLQRSSSASSRQAGFEDAANGWFTYTALTSQKNPGLAGLRQRARSPAPTSPTRWPRACWRTARARPATVSDTSCVERQRHPRGALLGLQQARARRRPTARWSTAPASPSP